MASQLRLPRRIIARRLILSLIGSGLVAAIATTGWYWSTMRQPANNHPASHFTSGLPLSLGGVFMPTTQDQAGLQTTSSSQQARTPSREFMTNLESMTLSPQRLGIYESIAPSDPQSLMRLEEIRQAGFNIVLNYDILDGTQDDITRYLDKAQSLGLKVIFSLKDFYDLEKNSSLGSSITAPYGQTNDQIVASIVQTYKNHPAVYGWYISDERPEAEGDISTWLPALTSRYQQVKQLDPAHPTMMVLQCYPGTFLNNPAALSRIAATTDELGFDTYPVPYLSTGLIGDCAQTLSQTIARPAQRWYVIQAFSWATYPNILRQQGEDLAQARYPTKDELIQMFSLARQAGVANIMVYSYFDLKNDPANFSQNWQNVTAAVHSIEARQ